MCELNLHNVLPGFSSGKMPGRSTVDGGKEESEEQEVWRVDKEVMKAVSAADLGQTPLKAAMLLGRWRKPAVFERGSSGDVAVEPFQHAGQSWDCSQVVYEPEERVVMDYDDQWEGVSKDEEKVKCEGGVTAKGYKLRTCSVRQGWWSRRPTWRRRCRM